MARQYVGRPDADVLRRRPDGSWGVIIDGRTVAPRRH